MNNNFDKRLVILQGIHDSSKVTVTLSSNKYGCSCYISGVIDDITSGQYMLAIKSDTGVQVFGLGINGRLSARLPVNIDIVEATIHCIIFVRDDGEDTPYLYGTTGSQRLWEGNMLDGVQREDEDSKSASNVGASNMQYYKIDSDKAKSVPVQVLTTNADNSDTAIDQMNTSSTLSSITHNIATSRDDVEDYDSSFDIALSLMDDLKGSSTRGYDDSAIASINYYDLGEQLDANTNNANATQSSANNASDIAQHEVATSTDRVVTVQKLPIFNNATSSAEALENFYNNAVVNIGTSHNQHATRTYDNYDNAGYNRGQLCYENTDNKSPSNMQMEFLQGDDLFMYPKSALIDTDPSYNNANNVYNVRLINNNILYQGDQNMHDSASSMRENTSFEIGNAIPNNNNNNANNRPNNNFGVGFGSSKEGSQARHTITNKNGSTMSINNVSINSRQLLQRQNAQSVYNPSHHIDNVPPQGIPTVAVNNTSNNTANKGFAIPNAVLDIPTVQSNPSIVTQSASKNKPLTFFDKISDQINKLFDTYQREETLVKMLPDTKWVRIDYDSSGKYYCIGLIGTKPDYICYAVPSIYTPEPPKELDGYCQWIPLDEFAPKGNGYWMLFQDAITGESVEN